MTTFLATFVMLATLMLIMAVGVMFSGRALKGSCGGVPGKECTCSSTDRQACESRNEPPPRPDDGHHHLDVVDE